MFSKASSWFGSERMVHAIIAIALAMLVSATTIFRPLDIAAWSLQSKLFDHHASGDIVFVGFDGGGFLANNATENQALTKALIDIDRSGASRIFVDMPISRSDSEETDRALRRELVRLNERVTLTKKIREDFADSANIGSTDPYFANGIGMVSSDYKTDFVGFVWELDTTNIGQGVRLESLSSALSNEKFEKQNAWPDYTISTSSIPQTSIDRIGIGAKSETGSLIGKTVVVGRIGSSAQLVKIPDGGIAPSSLLHIIAAETIDRGGGYVFGWGIFLALMALCLVLVIALCDRTNRKFGYAFLLSTPVFTILLMSVVGVKGVYSGAFALLGVYGIQRIVSAYKGRHIFIDPRTKMPNFHALLRDVGNESNNRSRAIVVAKIARLDAIFSGFSASEQRAYLRQVATRLSLGDDENVIYTDGGKYLAFLLANSDYQDLEGHLQGLRAISSQSITISGRPIDVAMTIGADRSSGTTASNRLSAAIAAADQAREAYRPVFVIEDNQPTTELWDHSLQSRLELALSEDRISIRLQPKVNLSDGTIVGAEALARWVDEERGDIPPSRFIMQCERVGKLDDLTQRVLSKSLLAANNLRAADHAPSISVNVSAVQFVDSRIASMIEKNVEALSGDPGQLIIELTETARIEDFATARKIIERIKEMGVRFSIDDFGIASANLEALYKLPFDEIKIDRMFVSQMRQSNRARAIVSNVIRLAEDAQLVSVAEGVEDGETYRLLRDMGCHMAQGYFVARPLAESEFREMLTLQREAPSLRKDLA